MAPSASAPKPPAARQSNSRRVGLSPGNCMFIPCQEENPEASSYEPAATAFWPWRTSTWVWRYGATVASMRPRPLGRGVLQPRPGLLVAVHDEGAVQASHSVWVILSYLWGVGSRFGHSFGGRRSNLASLGPRTVGDRDTPGQLLRLDDR